jgi:type VI secretion system protein ImpG
LPTTSRENAAYKIITEFNAFPKKFMFFKIVFKIQPKNQIIIPFSCNKDIFLKKNNLLLNCTPAINLFEKNSEPLNINQKDTSYTIKADNNLGKNIEIYSVLSVEDTQFNSNKKYLPYFECNHFLDDDKQNIFWIMQRYKSKNLKQNENKILFIDNSGGFEKSVLYAKLLCLQKNANALDANENWNINSANINLKCVNLDKPTEYIPPISSSRTQWRLISHLAVNHFGIEGEQGLNYIKELLSIYNIQNHNNASVISCLKSLEYASSMVYEDMCMLPKAQITLVADSHKSSKVFLLARVLGAFFGKTLSFNTKIDLELRKFENNKVWKSWKII